MERYRPREESTRRFVPFARRLFRWDERGMAGREAGAAVVSGPTEPRLRERVPAAAGEAPLVHVNPSSGKGRRGRGPDRNTVGALPTDLTKEVPAETVAGTGLLDLVHGEEWLKKNDALAISWDARSVPRLPPKGIVNAGDSCFIAAALQLLLRVGTVRRWLTLHVASPHCAALGLRDVSQAPKRHRVARVCSLCLLRRVMDELANPVCMEPARLVEFIGAVRDKALLGSTFRVGQCDSAEFLAALIRRLVQDEREERTLRLGARGLAVAEIPAVTALDVIAGGMRRKRVACGTCRLPVDHMETFRPVQLDLTRVPGKHLHLGLLLAQHYLARGIGACHRTGGRVGGCMGQLHQQVFWEMPPRLLVLMLNRNIDGRQKDGRPVQFPEHGLQVPGVRHGSGYRLLAVLEHQSKLRQVARGHYICAVREQGGPWHRYDDESVRPIKWSEVQKLQAYVLVYVQESPERARVEEDPEWDRPEGDTALVREYLSLVGAPVRDVVHLFGAGVPQVGAGEAECNAARVGTEPGPDPKGQVAAAPAAVQAGSTNPSTPVVNPVGPPASSSGARTVNAANPGVQAPGVAAGVQGSAVPRPFVNVGDSCYINALLQAMFAVNAVRELLVTHFQAGQQGLREDLWAVSLDGDSPVQVAGGRARAASGMQTLTLTARARQRSVLDRLAVTYATCMSSPVSRPVFAGLFARRHFHGGLGRRVNSLARPFPSGMYRGEQADPHDFFIGQLTPHAHQLQELFAGDRAERIICRSCSRPRPELAAVDAFYGLTVDINHETVTSVQQAVDRHFRPEHLESLRGWECTYCSDVAPPDHAPVLVAAPKALMVHLVRWLTEGYVEGQGGVARQRLVGKRIVPDQVLRVPVAFSDELVSYDLRGFVVHGGQHSETSSSGHYIACARHADAGDTWHTYNDTRRSPASAADLATSDQWRSYVLFYERRDAPGLEG